MKPALVALFALIVLIANASSARAQHQGAISAGVMAGTMNAPLAIKPGLPGRQLEDWIDPRTGVTTHSAIGCDGVVAEATLSGTSNHNFVTVTVLNDSAARVTLMPSQSRARFGRSTYRQLIGGGSDELLEMDWFVTRTFRFPEKEIFEDQSTLDVELKVLVGPRQEACKLTVYFERDRAVPASERTHTQFSTLDVEFALGPRFYEDGGVRDVGSGSGVSLHLDFSLFFGVHHGMTLNLAGDFHGSSAVDTVARDANHLEGKATISGTGFLLGYIGRTYFTPWLSFAYNASTGPYIYELTDESERGPLLTTAVFPLRHRLRFAADVITLDDGSRFSVAASFIHLFIPYGDFGTVKLQGNSMAATLELMVGI